MAIGSLLSAALLCLSASAAHLQKVTQHRQKLALF